MAGTRSPLKPSRSHPCDLAEAPGYSRAVLLSVVGRSPAGGLGPTPVAPPPWLGLLGRSSAQVVEEEVLCLCVVPGTDLVVSGSVTALLTVWGSSRSWAVAAVCEGHSQPVWAACYLHQVHKCASGGEDHCVRIWSADTWECERVLCGHEGRVAGLSFGQPGWLLSCGSDGTVRAWDCGEWKEVRVFDDQQCEAIVVYGDAPRAPREECASPPACAVEGLPPSRVEPLPAASGAAAAPLAVCLEEVPAPPGCPTQAARARRAKLVAEMAESPLAKVCEEMRADLAGGAPATPQEIVRQVQAALEVSMKAQIDSLGTTLTQTFATQFAQLSQGLERKIAEQNAGMTDNILTPVMMNNVTPQYHCISQSYSLTFSSEAMAKECTEVFNNSDNQWMDPRDGSMHYMKARSDLPKDVRTTQRALSKVWDPIIELFGARPRYTAGSKPIINGYKGTIHWSDGNDVWPLVSCSDVNHASFTFDIDQDTVSFFSLDTDKLNRLQTGASPLTTFQSFFACMLRGLQLQVKERLAFQIGAFADDIYFVARNLCKTLPQVLARLVLSGKVTRLTLNYKKCVIVVLNLVEKKDVLEAFRGRGLDVSRYQIQRSGKLLGIQVGERGFLDAWQPVAVKIRSRTEGARRLGLSFIQSAQAFNTYVVPVTSHVGQFYLPSKEDDNRTLTYKWNPHFLNSIFWNMLIEYSQCIRIPDAPVELAFADWLSVSQMEYYAYNYSFTISLHSRYAAHFSDVKVHVMGPDMMTHIVCDDFNATNTCATSRLEILRSGEADLMPLGQCLRRYMCSYARAFTEDARALAEEILVHVCGESCFKYSGSKDGELAKAMERESIGFYINAYTTKQLPDMQGALEELRRGIERLEVRREDTREANRSVAEILHPIMFDTMTYFSHRCWNRRGAQTWRNKFGQAVRRRHIQDGGGVGSRYLTKDKHYYPLVGWGRVRLDGGAELYRHPGGAEFWDLQSAHDYDVAVKSQSLSGSYKGERKGAERKSKGNEFEFDSFEYPSLWETEEVIAAQRGAWLDRPGESKPRATVKQCAAIVGLQVAQNLGGLARARMEHRPRQYQSDAAVHEARLRMTAGGGGAGDEGAGDAAGDPPAAPQLKIGTFEEAPLLGMTSAENLRKTLTYGHRARPKLFEKELLALPRMGWKDALPDHSRADRLFDQGRGEAWRLQCQGLHDSMPDVWSGTDHVDKQIQMLKLQDLAFPDKAAGGDDSDEEEEAPGAGDGKDPEPAHFKWQSANIVHKSSGRFGTKRPGAARLGAHPLGAGPAPVRAAALPAMASRLDVLSMNKYLDRVGNHVRAPTPTISRTAIKSSGLPTAAAHLGPGHYRLDRDFVLYERSEVAKGKLTTCSSSPAFKFPTEPRIEPTLTLKGLMKQTKSWINELAPGDYGTQDRRDKKQAPSFSVSRARRFPEMKVAWGEPGPGDYYGPSEESRKQSQGDLEQLARRHAAAEWKPEYTSPHGTVFRSIRAPARPASQGGGRPFR
ncbi:unnamed protein product [Prorocentrum cordatum]|uniref:Uncharacterized protein n=1 Tax=Prorocentrum cordatum TaxID=2364126 RepID=A0ABN9Q1M3_9DINO|nr:unnamed protein product [Polarella glacialis]